jgi:hypothetical protein
VNSQCHHGDLLVQPVAARPGQRHRLVGVLEGSLRAGEIEVLLEQPRVMRRRPCLAAGIDDPVPQQQFREPMPSSHQV